MFTQVGREITIAAREGGGNVEFNFRLRLAVEKARSVNMPRENIDRAIKRGSGELKGEELVELAYEAYGPHGVAIIVQVLTDNRNRAVAEVRRVITRQGGSMAEAGSVSWQFERKGYMAITPDGGNADQIFEMAVEAGADDVIVSEDMVQVFAAPEDFQAVRQALEKAELTFEAIELSLVPKTPVQLDDDDTIQVMGVISALEDLDDVQQVYSNMDISDTVLARFEEAA
jgi:YebC/PmpR family DNA-binding regulatory protein